MAIESDRAARILADQFAAAILNEYCNSPVNNSILYVSLYTPVEIVS